MQALSSQASFAVVDDSEADDQNASSSIKIAMFINARVEPPHAPDVPTA